MNRKLFNIFIGCVVFLISLCFLSSFFNNEKEMLFTFEENDISKINTWTLKSEGVNGEIEMVEFDPKYTNFEPYSITSELSTEDFKNPVIMLESMHQAFTISINSEIIYQFGHEDKSIFSVPNGGIWHVVKLPYLHEENNITINVVPSDDKTSIGIIDIYLAEESQAILFLVYGNAVKLLISSIILIIGLILLVSQFFMSKGLKNNNLILYLGLLSINMAIWLLSESNLMQFIIGDTFILGNLPYWSIQLLFIPFIFYVESMYTPSHKSISKYFTIAFIVNFIVSGVLHMTGTVFYYSTLGVVHLIMVLTLLYFVFSLGYESLVKKNNDAKIIILQISFLILAAMMELVIFYFGNNMNSIGVSLQVGMLLYLLACIISTSLKLRAIWAEGMYTEYLSKIAYTDILTSAFNRHAFERDLEVFKENENLTKIIIIFDLNNLKFFNDTMGHQTGDDYLIYFIELAQKYLSEFGNCYRVGGDEFAAILSNVSYETVEKRLSIIQEEIKKFDKSNMAGVAIGYAQYDKNEYPDINDYLHYLDKCMFENKNTLKK